MALGYLTPDKFVGAMCRFRRKLVYIPGLEDEDLPEKGDKITLQLADDFTLGDIEEKFKKRLSRDMTQEEQEWITDSETCVLHFKVGKTKLYRDIETVTREGYRFDLLPSSNLDKLKDLYKVSRRKFYSAPVILISLDLMRSSRGPSQ